MNALRHSVALIVINSVLFLSACASPVKSKPNAYSYLGRVVEGIDETVTEQYIRPSYDPRKSEALKSGQFGAVGIAIYEANKEGDNTVIANKTSDYHRYKVALEQGEQITLRSYVPNIKPGDCVRIWIVGPGVSPVYWYSPNITQIEPASGCSE